LITTEYLPPSWYRITGEHAVVATRSKDASRDPQGAGTLERQYRVTLDFRLLACEITPELCRKSFFFSDEGRNGGEHHLGENVERQRRLYRLLRDDEPVLERYLLSVITAEAGRYASDGLADAVGVEDEDELLVPLIRGMAEEDVEFFEECRQSGALAENTELVAQAFMVEWVGAEVEEVSQRVVGDVKRADVVERTKTRLMKHLNARH
jgi:hypothetical protein